MPAKSERQRKMMGANLARKRTGKKTRTGMSEANLVDFASKSFVMKDALVFLNEYIDKQAPKLPDNLGQIREKARQKLRDKSQSAGQDEGGKYPHIRARGETADMQVPQSNVSGEGESAHEKLAGGVARGLVARRQEADPDPRGVVPSAVLEQEGIRQPVSPANVLNEQEILYRRRRKGDQSPRRLWTGERQPYSKYGRRPSPRVSEENLERQAVANFEDVGDFAYPELNTAQKRELQQTTEANVALSAEGTRNRTNVNKSSDKQLMDITLKAFSEYIDILEKERLEGQLGLVESVVDTARERGLAGLGTEAGLTIQEGFRRTGEAALGGAKKLAYGTDKVLTGAVHGREGLARRKRAMEARRQPVKPQEKPPSQDGGWQDPYSKDSSQAATGDNPGSTWEMPFNTKWTDKEIRRKMKERADRLTEENIDATRSPSPSQGSLPPSLKNEMRQLRPDNKVDIRDSDSGSYRSYSKSSDQVSPKDLLPHQDEQGNFIPNESIPFTPDVGNVLSLAADAIETHVMKEHPDELPPRATRRNKKKASKRKMKVSGAGVKDSQRLIGVRANKARKARNRTED